MKNKLQTTILMLSGSFAVLFIFNFLVHLFFYIIGGSLAKFVSPVWLVLNGIMVILSVIYVMVSSREKGRVRL